MPMRGECEAMALMTMPPVMLVSAISVTVYSIRRRRAAMPVAPGELALRLAGEGACAHQPFAVDADVAHGASAHRVEQVRGEVVHWRRVQPLEVEHHEIGTLADLEAADQLV